jgi:dimethylglycine dehydrogenase
MTSLDPRRFGAYADEDYVAAKAFDAYVQMYALHIPGEEREAGRPRRLSPIHEKLVAKGCVHTEAFGWERPKWFSPDGREEDLSYRRNNVFEIVAEECRAVHERVGVLELSSFAKFDVTGRDAESFLNRVFANRMPSRTGGIKLAHLLNDAGRIQTEATVSRVSEECFYILTGAAWEVKDFDALTQSVRPEEQVEIENVTDRWGNLIVAGPRARDLLALITDTDLSNSAFRWLTAQESEFAGVPCRALRVNYVGELGWELHHPIERMPELYDAIWEAGQKYGIADFGAYAVNSLRLEKGYRGIGAEMTNEISTVEAGLHRFVDMGKGDFVGRAALEQIERKGVAQQLVYLEVDASDADCLGGEPIYCDGEDVVGVTTSGGFGHRTQKSLAFGYVAPRFAEAGTRLAIEILEERRAATVLSPEPVFDPRNERLRV